MSMDQNKIPISFDEDNRIRILESEHFRKTENLAEESTNFVQSTRTLTCCSFGRHFSLAEFINVSPLAVTVAEIGQFEKTADSLVDILSVQAGKIERQKLMVRRPLAQSFSSAFATDRQFSPNTNCPPHTHCRPATSRRSVCETSARASLKTASASSKSSPPT